MARRDFSNYLRSCITHLHFKPCLEDLDVSMRTAIKSDGIEYCEYMLLYTNDVLVVSANAEIILTDKI